MKLQSTMVLTVFLAATIGQAKSMEKKFQKACSSIHSYVAKTGDAELKKAAQACSENFKLGALSLTLSLAGIASASAESANGRLEFIAGHLDKLRNALVASDEWNRSTPLVNIGSKLAELSGFAFDAKTESLFGISDETASVVQVNLDSLAAFSFDLSNVETKDAEAILTTADGTVWVMDIGNNDNERSEIYMHSLDPREVSSGQVKSEKTITLHYPSGKRPNVEAAILSNGVLYLFEKALYSPAEIFAVGFDETAPDLTLQSVGFLPAGSPISDAVVDPATNKVYVLGWFDLREVSGLGEASAKPSSEILWKGFFGQQEALSLDHRKGSGFSRVNPDVKSSERNFLIGTELGEIFSIQL